jgi:hypothetical protein
MARRAVCCAGVGAGASLGRVLAMAACCWAWNRCLASSTPASYPVLYPTEVCAAKREGSASANAPISRRPSVDKSGSPRDRDSLQGRGGHLKTLGISLGVAALVPHLRRDSLETLENHPPCCCCASAAFGFGKKLCWQSGGVKRFWSLFTMGRGVEFPLLVYIYTKVLEPAKSCPGG